MFLPSGSSHIVVKCNKPSSVLEPRNSPRSEYRAQHLMGEDGKQFGLRLGHFRGTYSPLKISKCLKMVSRSVEGQHFYCCYPLLRGKPCLRIAREECIVYA